MFISSGAQAAACSYTYRQIEVEVGGTPVLTEIYTPENRSPIGTVFMLHGSAGLYTPPRNREPSLDNFGEKSFANGCYQVFLPHYFQVVNRASLPSLAEIEAAEPTLLSSVNLLLDQAENTVKLPNQPVFLYGESLGAFLAVAVSLGRKEVKAVSEISGGLNPGTRARLRNKRVSMLLSHGMQDDVVPFQQALALRAFCHQFHIRAKLDAYNGVGHYFPPREKLRCIFRTEALFDSLAVKQGKAASRRKATTGAGRF